MLPILTIPALGPDGVLRWHVRHGDAVATLDVESGSVYYNEAASLAPESFRTVVGALIEWFRTDTEDFNGLNALKLRSEMID